MQPAVDLNCSRRVKVLPLSPIALIWQDVLAQAMTGEHGRRDELHLLIGDL